MIFKNHRSGDWTCLFKLEVNFHKKKIVYDDLDVFIKDTINWPALFSVSIYPIVTYSWTSISLTLISQIQWISQSDL